MTVVLTSGFLTVFLLMKSMKALEACIVDSSWFCVDRQKIRVSSKHKSVFKDK